MTLRRVLVVLAVAAVGVAVATALGVWLVVADEVAVMRSARARATTPVPAPFRSAIVATEDPLLFAPPRFSFRALIPPSERVRSCAPTFAHRLVKSMAPSPPRRALWSHLETAITMQVVTRMFTPEELLRIYSNEIYLGKVDGRQIFGVEAASGAYFGKASRDLTTAEAATLAAIVRAPNVFSPLEYPERVLPRRNRVLERMFRARFIDESEYRRALGEPLRAART